MAIEKRPESLRGSIPLTKGGLVKEPTVLDKLGISGSGTLKLLHHNKMLQTLLTNLQVLQN